ALGSLSRDTATLTVAVPDSLPAVDADPALLERSVANVVDNALSWSPSGRQVRVEAGEVGDRVDLRVIDQGPGIPMSERDRVFQPFQRLADRGRVTPHGVGLGLAGARGFVEARGAEIRQTLEVTLRARRYGVDLASNGEEALALAARHHPDVVILDLGLPGIDGIEVVRGLRGWTQVPIVILSVRDREADKVAALDAGADDYVTKPFGMDELLARIRAAIRRSSVTDAAPAVATDDFVVDLAAHRVSRTDGRDVSLTPTEWLLVEVLVRNRDRLVTQRQLLQQVWGPAYERETNYLRSYMATIRRQLEPNPSQPRYFRTEPGVGVRFVPDGNGGDRLPRPERSTGGGPGLAD